MNGLLHPWAEAEETGPLHTALFISTLGQETHFYFILFESE